MSQRDFHGGRAYAASGTAPGGAGYLFGIGLAIAWLRMQIVGLFRRRAS